MIADPVHKKFLEKLSGSREAVWQIAMMLSEDGQNVQINAIHAAPTRGDADRFTDLGDLEVMLRVEVKSLGCDFTSADDWPFHDFIVCNKRSYDRSYRKPARFYYLNRKMTHYATLNVKPTRKNWKVSTKRDSTYDGVGEVNEEFYVCSINNVAFSSLET